MYEPCTLFNRNIPDSMKIAVLCVTTQYIDCFRVNISNVYISSSFLSLAHMAQLIVYYITFQDPNKHLYSVLSIFLHVLTAVFSVVFCF